jgi:hypothetical protein
LLFLFLIRRSRRDDDGPNGLVLAGIGSPGPAMGGSQGRGAPPIASTTAASVAVVDAVAAPAKRRGRPRPAAVAGAVADVAEPTADATEVADEDAVIDEDRPLAHVRQAARTAPSAPPADLPSPEPPIVDDATGAFAAAVAARQPKKKRGKEPAAQARAEAPAEEPAAATPTSTKAAAASTAKTFAKAAAKGVERARITYRQVRISSEPDLVQSVELGRLDRGDEVELVESFEGFLRVRTPDGVTGWIVRHTIA